MKSEWKVSTQVIDKPVYQVYRRKNMDLTDHSGNREYAGIYTSKEEAQTRADELNKKGDA